MLPRLDATNCTGSGDCVSVCPTRCLTMDGSLPWLPRPLDCVACDLCALICPAGAIVLAPANLAAAMTVDAVEKAGAIPKMSVPKA